MDDIDAAIMAAWGRVWERCRADPAEALRRWRRTRQAGFLRPPREWCFKLRASDRRMVAGWNALAYPETEVVAYQQAHTLVLQGSELRGLLAPVEIPWPGVPLSEAARLLGHGQPTLRSWMPVAQGRSRAELDAAGVRRWETYRRRGHPLAVRYTAATVHGHRGYDVPVVWSEGPLDPNAMRGEPPHPIWGTLWQGFHARLVADFEMKFRRVPHHIRKGGKWQFLGWRWVCRGRKIPGPGRRRHVPCGRTAKVLYGPLPIFTVARALGLAEGLGVGSAKPQAAGELTLAGDWFPGLVDPREGGLCFACKACWQVQSFTLSHAIGWNNFVTYITGGLLYGHEVARPGWVRYERRKAAYGRGSAKPRQSAGEGKVGVA